MDGTPRTRARRRTRPSEPQAAPIAAPAPAGLADQVELLEDHTRPIAHGRARRRLTVSVPGAIFGAFLVAALALGASLGPSLPADGGSDGETAALDGGHDGDATEPDADKPADEPGSEPDGDKPVDEPGNEQPGDEPDGDKPADKPADEPGDKPADEQPGEGDPKPEPPARETIEIGVGLNDAGVVVEWSVCERDGFVAYKIIRSPDAAVTYPRGDNDSLVGAVEAMSRTRFVDLQAPHGKKIFYRVFGVATHEGVPYVACASGVEDVVTPKPEPKPEIGTLGLSLAIKEGVPYVDWTSCEVDGDFLYKIVRSKDSTVHFPLGARDSLVATVGGDGKTSLFDEDVDPGQKVWYRVVCVRPQGEGYRVLAASPAKSITRPAPKPEPLPEPSVMGFEVDIAGEGVALTWEQCNGEQFAFYKVIRSRNPNPSYLPGTEGSEVIAVFENHEITHFVDTTADAGTWHYRVQSIGYANGQKFLLGQTPVRSVTVE